ncbi:MAG: (2Fe-2S)-binding protein [Desulfurococcaceae archaeon]|nr:(2Fe-2S)-binding protein [Desulfurococcaceae archaeon]
MKITFKVNGEPVTMDVKPNELLINVLRDKLKLTGTKYVCGIGECGACTVLLDGEPILSCLTLAVDVNGREVTTIEGISKGDELSEVQEAFVEEGAIQCGYCIPGFIIMGEYLLRIKQKPTEDEIKEYLRGNLCRCTGYVNIIKAIKKASELKISKTK